MSSDSGHILSALNIFTARRYALAEYAMALCPSVCSLQVAAQPITVVCKATRVYMPILGGVVERFTVCSAKMAEPIDGKAPNLLRYMLNVKNE